jgi:hypothetical protein
LRRAVLRASLALALSATGTLVTAEAPQAATTDHACAHAAVRVRAALAADAREACAGAQDALGFFAAQGLAPTEPLLLEIVPQLPDAAGPSAAGCYLEAQKRILLATYADFRKARTWFKLPIERTLYRSLAAHETAHAVAACSFGITRPTVQAKEYVAYVAMLATMPVHLRDRVLRAFPDAAFADDDRITAVFYMFEPMAFGVAAWRHYAQAGKGPAFLQDVLAGRRLGD